MDELRVHITGFTRATTHLATTTVSRTGLVALSTPLRTHGKNTGVGILDTFLSVQQRTNQRLIPLLGIVEVLSASNELHETPPKVNGKPSYTAKASRLAGHHDRPALPPVAPSCGSGCHSVMPEGLGQNS